MGRRRRRERQLSSRPELAHLKYDVAQEIGLVPPGTTDPGTYERALDRHKYEVASELGLLDDIKTRGWPLMTSRDCGRIGGRVGGRIGGQMVRRMIDIARQDLS